MSVIKIYYILLWNSLRINKNIVFNIKMSSILATHFYAEKWLSEIFLKLGWKLSLLFASLEGSLEPQNTFRVCKSPRQKFKLSPQLWLYETSKKTSNCVSMDLETYDSLDGEIPLHLELGIQI